MMGVHGKCKLENPCESFCLQKAWHAQFLRKEPRLRSRPFSWSATLFLGGMFWFRPWRPSRGAGVDYLLSTIFIIGMFGTLYGPWRVLRGIDELPEPGHLPPALDMVEKIRAMRAAREARNTSLRLRRKYCEPRRLPRGRTRSRQPSRTLHRRHVENVS